MDHIVQVCAPGVDHADNVALCVGRNHDGVRSARTILIALGRLLGIETSLILSRRYHEAIVYPCGCPVRAQQIAGPDRIAVIIHRHARFHRAVHHVDPMVCVDITEPIRRGIRIRNLHSVHHNAVQLISRLGRIAYGERLHVGHPRIPLRGDGSSFDR